MRWLPLCRFPWFVSLLALALLAGLCGCVTADPGEQSSEEKLPWNAPAGWEGKTLGVPF